MSNEETKDERIIRLEREIHKCRNLYTPIYTALQLMIKNHPDLVREIKPILDMIDREVT
jgi:hypothetical protein